MPVFAIPSPLGLNLTQVSVTDHIPTHQNATFPEKGMKYQIAQTVTHILLGNRFCGFLI